MKFITHTIFTVTLSSVLMLGNAKDEEKAEEINKEKSNFNRRAFAGSANPAVGKHENSQKQSQERAEERIQDIECCPLDTIESCGKAIGDGCGWFWNGVSRLCGQACDYVGGKCKKCYVCCCCGIIHCMYDEESNCNTCLAMTCGCCEHVCCNGQIADLENPGHCATCNYCKTRPRRDAREHVVWPEMTCGGCGKPCYGPDGIYCSCRPGGKPKERTAPEPQEEEEKAEPSSFELIKPRKKVGNKPTTNPEPVLEGVASLPPITEEETKEIGNSVTFVDPYVAQPSTDKAGSAMSRLYKAQGKSKASHQSRTPPPRAATCKLIEMIQQPGSTI